MTTPIRSMPQLIDALRARAVELQLTHATIDDVAGLQGGYTSKLLAPNPIKNLGPVSFESILGALGLAVIVVEDEESVKRFSGQWEQRKRPLRKPKTDTLSMTLSIENQVPAQIAITPELQRKLKDPKFMKSIGKLGGKRRLKTMGKRARQRAAAHAARIRWARVDVAG